MLTGVDPGKDLSSVGRCGRLVAMGALTVAIVNRLDWMQRDYPIDAADATFATDNFKAGELIGKALSNQGDATDIGMRQVFADALAGIANEPYPPRRKIIQPPEPVENLAAGGIGVERVDGEIAPRRILAPVGGPGHAGMAAVGVEVAPQAGHLHRLAAATGPLL